MSVLRDVRSHSDAQRGTGHPTRTACAIAALVLMSSSLAAAPAIRTSSANRVPACASPDRLMQFLASRNPAVDPRYREIARWYKYWGEAWRVRWDYAFFQMVIETNALKFRRADGSRGDVHEKQNNFAGIGATGGGVPGDRFPDIETGVHAQIQHLVAYSGERLAAPIAPRTEQQQDNIIKQSLRLQRAVTFGDLARRWAADRAYSRTIDAVAEQFNSGFCRTVVANVPARDVPQPQPAIRKLLAPFSPPYRLGGPKPAKLAGPVETLPWADPDVMAREYGDDTDTPIKREKDVPLKPAPVRTLWSRDGHRTDASPAPLSSTESSTETERRGANATGMLLPSSAASAAARAEGTAPATAAAANEPALPHFKIAPDISSSAPSVPRAPIPEPSRLGGPLPLLAPQSPAPMPTPTPTPLAPSARFKDILETPANVAADVPSDCSILAASYGGKKTLLVRAKVNGTTQYTALTVLDGFEKSMFDIYSKSQASNPEIIGEYATKDEALADARANCTK